MKNADKLFYGLGYELDKLSEKPLYCKDLLDKNLLGYIDSEMICFDDKYNAIYFINKYILTMQELKAINMKCEELNWLGDTNE